MNLMAISATEADLTLIQEIANTHLQSFNPLEKKVGEMEAREFVRGFVDPATTRFTKFEGQDTWQSFLTLNPDLARRRYYLDIYSRPGAKTLPATLNLALELAKAGNPDFQLWLGVHSKDSEYKKLLAEKRFSLLRRYWTMQMELNSNLESSKSNASIREISLDNPDELRSFFDINQDSFSKHFGFKPRPYENWCEMVLRDREELNLRVWLISIEGTDVGFLDCDDSLVHEESGFVAGLGVRLAFHGLGLGEALLRHAIRVNTQLGRKKLCLSVDAGNESGALRLYEKVGMSPISEWHHYENPNWAQVV